MQVSQRYNQQEIIKISQARNSKSIKRKQMTFRSLSYVSFVLPKTKFLEKKVFSIFINEDSIQFILIKSMDQKPFPLSHSFETKLKYLLSILEEKDLGLSKSDLMTLKLPPCTYDISSPKHIQRLNILQRHFIDDQSKLVNNQYFNNFLIIIALKLSLSMAKKIQIQSQLSNMKSLSDSCPIREFKSFKDKDAALKVINQSKYKLIKGWQTFGTLAQQLSRFDLQHEESFYYLLLALYYYSLKYKFIEAYQFQVLSFQKHLIKLQNIYQKFYIDYSKQLRYFTNKISQIKTIIDKKTTLEIINLLCNQQINEKNRICLSQIIRNIVNNGGIQQILVEDLIKVVNHSNVKEIKIAMCSAIVCFQHSSKPTQAERAKTFIDKIIQGQDAQLNQLFIQRRIMLRMRNQEFKEVSYIPREDVNSFKSIENHTFRNKFTTKNISADQNFQRQNQFDLRKMIQSSKNKQLNISIEHNHFVQIQDPLNLKETQNQATSSELSWMNGTFQTVKRLFIKASNQQILYKSDKDQYLLKKFMNKGSKYSARGLLGQFFIDRMIANIYQIISRQQRLTFKTIKLLIQKCVKNQQVFFQDYLKSLEADQNKMNKLFKQNSLSYDYHIQLKDNFIQKFLNSISKNFIDNKFIEKQIDRIRVGVISTLYHTQCLQPNENNQQLDRQIINHIKNYQCSKLESEYFNYILKICDLKKKLVTQNKAQSYLFKNCIQQLQNEKCKQQCINYIFNQSSNKQNYNHIFKESQIDKIVSCMIIQKNKNYFSQMLRIITFFLINTPKSIELVYFQKIKQNQNTKYFRIQFQTAYYLNTREEKKTELIQKYLQNYNQQYSKLSKSENQDDQQLQLIILLIIYNFSHKLPIRQLGKLSLMLNNHKTISFEGEHINFRNQASKDQNLLISEITAHIINNSIEKFSNEITVKLKPIFDFFSQCNFRTRHILAKALKSYQQKKMIQPEYFPEMQLLFQSNHEPEIKFKIIKSYLAAVKKNIKEFDPNQIHKILITQMHQYNQQIKEINEQILNLLDQITKENLKQFTEVKNYNIITFFFQKDQYLLVKKSIQILKNISSYAQQYNIPKSVLQALDNIIEKKDFEQFQVNTLLNLKQAIYENLVKNQQEITIQQAKIWVNKLKDCQDFDKGIAIFNKLDKISKNQDLPKELFDIIELERCCSRYNPQKNNEQIQEKIIQMTSKGIHLNYMLNFTKIFNNISLQSINVIKILYNISFSQKISIVLIKQLLVIYKPNAKSLDEKEILITKIIVNNYLNFQMDQIFKENKFFLSINNPKLLQIALPLILKQKLQQQSDQNINTLTKLMDYFEKTKDIRHKQSISALFLNQRIIQLLQYSIQNIQQLLFPKDVYTQQLIKNCESGLKILSIKGSDLAKKYLDSVVQKRQIEQSKKDNQQNKLESLKRKSFIDCLKFSQRQQSNQSFLIFEKIKQILQVSNYNNEFQNQIEQIKKLKLNQIKRDYLFCKHDLQYILEFFSLNWPVNSLNLKVKKQYLQLIMILSSIHECHIYQSLVLKKISFVLIIQKIFISESLNLQIIQIYIKIIEQSSCKQIELVLNSIIVSLKNIPPKDLLFKILVLLEKSLLYYPDDFKIFLVKENKQRIFNILQNNLESSLENIKYISVRLLNLLRQSLKQQSPKFQIFRKSLLERFNNGVNIEIFNRIPEILILQKIPQIEISQQSDIIVQNIEQIVLKICLLKISKDDASRLQFKIIWNQNFNKIQKIEDRIQLLIQIYLNSQQAHQKSTQDFLKFFIFNDSFKENQEKLIKDIKNHKLQQQKLIKLLIHHYIQKLSQKQFFQPEKILHITFYSNIKSINHFFSDILLLSSQQINEAINLIYDNKLSLQQLIQTKSKLSLKRIQSLSILKQIISILKEIITLQKKQQLRQLIQQNLKHFKTQQILWMIKQVNSLFKVSQLKNLLQLMDLTSHFEIKQPNYIKELVGKSIQKCKSDPLKIFQILNKSYIKAIIPQKTDRTPQQCLQLLQFYPKKLQIQYLKIKKDIFQQLSYVKDKESYESIYERLNMNKIKKLSLWTQKEYKKWAVQVKSKKSNLGTQFIKEALLIIKAAIQYKTSTSKKLVFRNNQIISCLVMLTQLDKDSNIVLQISTGQGKSVILCAVAIILTLKGRTVDIITTSSILAQRDAQIYSNVYRMFGISVSHNKDKQKYSEGLKKCYQSDVVYGQLSQFQFDQLRDFYNESNTFGKRKKDIVIVDEVDSMLIDDSSKIAKISSNIIGMDRLQIIYISIWQKLLMINKNILQVGGQYYYFDGRIQEKQGKMIFYYKQDEEQMEISDLQKYFKNKQKLIDKIKLFQNNGRQSLKNILIDSKKQIIGQVPSNFKQLIDIQFPKWIQSAIQALYYQEKCDYIIENQCVVPVDYENTGKIENSTSWGNGLHQFLQIKHFLKFLPENLTTNFISNFKYFQQYKKLIGVTGTVGSQNCQKALNAAYKVDIIFIPDSFVKKMVLYPLLSVETSYEWIQNIKQKVHIQLRKRRGILIICQTIFNCNYIYDSLLKSGCKNLKLYNMNDKGQQQCIQSILPQQIIIATNLAGRGTDINAKDIEESGGLHVIVTFLPKNLRVQDQVKGRTCRKGNSGSCQFIINKQYLSKDYLQKDILNTRDQKQKLYLDKFMETKMKIIKKDNIFHNFCVFFKQIKIKLKKLKDENIQYYIKSSIEQRWAILFNKYQSEKQSKQFLQQFVKEINDEIKMDQTFINVIKNPYILNKIGFYLNLRGEIQKATNYFILSIKKDPEIISTWIGIGQICLKDKKQSIFKKYFQDQYKQQQASNKQAALFSYQKAQKLIKDQFNFLSKMQQYSTGNCGQKSFYQQNLAKIDFLSIYYIYLERIISQLKQSKKLITISITNPMIQEKSIIQFQKIQRNKTKVEELLNKNEGALIKELRYHYLNTAENNQSKTVFKELSKFNQYPNNKQFNLQLKNINFCLKYVDKGFKQTYDILNQYETCKINKAKILCKQDNYPIEGNINQVIKMLGKKYGTYDYRTYDIQLYEYFFMQNDTLDVCSIDIKCKLTHYNALLKLTENFACSSYQLSCKVSKNKFNQLYQIIKNIKISAFVQQNQYYQQQIKRNFKDLNEFSKLNLEHQLIEINLIAKNIQEMKLIQQNILKKDIIQDQSVMITYKNSTKYQTFCIENVHLDILFHSFKGEEQKQKINNVIKVWNNIKNNKKKNASDLVILNLNKDQLLRLLEVQIKEQNIILKQNQYIVNCLKRSKREIDFFYIQQGMEYLPIIELKIYPTKTIIVLSVLALSELAAGIALTATGNLYPGLYWLQQGIADMFTLYSTHRDQEFNYLAFLTCKLLSPVVDLRTLKGLTTAIRMGFRGIDRIITQIIQKSRRQQQIQMIISAIQENLSHKKSINQIVRIKVVDYMKEKVQLLHVIDKLVMLDHIGKTDQFQKRITRCIKQSIHSQQAAYSIKKLIKWMNCSKEQDYFTSLDISYNIQKIVAKLLLHLQIKIYQIQKNMLKLNTILKKYSNMSLNQIQKLYENMKNNQAFIKKKKLVINGKFTPQYMLEQFNPATLQIMMKINKSDTFLISCQKFFRIEKDSSQKITNIFSQELSSLIINKLNQQIVSSNFQDEKVDTQQKLKHSCLISIDSQDQYLINDIVKKNHQCQQSIVTQTNQSQLQKSLSQYNQLILVKQATPVDLIILSEQLDLKIKIIRKQQKFIEKTDNFLIYTQDNQKYSFQTLHFKGKIIDFKDINMLDQGFRQIASILGITIQAVRKQYEKIFYKKRYQFIKYLKNYKELYQKGAQKSQRLVLKKK